MPPLDFPGLFYRKSMLLSLERQSCNLFFAPYLVLGLTMVLNENSQKPKLDPTDIIHDVRYLRVFLNDRIIRLTDRTTRHGSRQARSYRRYVRPSVRGGTNELNE
jgi:hypothetical protein